MDNPSDSSRVVPKAVPRVVVVQDGARLHYAVPIALHQNRALERMYSAVYIKPRSPAALLASLAATLFPDRGKRFAERHNPALDSAHISTNFPLALRHARGKSSFPSLRAFYAWETQNTGRWISDAGFGNANGLFGFVRNVDPALCARAREKGLIVVADQLIATAVEEQRQRDLQTARFPDWPAGVRSAPGDDATLIQLERDTWAQAHAITCASDYVRTSLIESGIAEGRIHVLPYPIDASNYAFVDRSGRTGPVNVGFVGAVGIRKGAPYFLDVARKLRNANIRFTMIGASQFPGHLRAEHPNVDFLGHRPRSEVLAKLAEFDLFFLPSTCEGSAGAVMEAMATGLPIVTTPNTGSVVREAIDGFIRPYDDTDGLAAVIDKLAADTPLRLQIGRNARAHVETYTLAHYGKSLTALYASLLAAQKRA